MLIPEEEDKFARDPGLLIKQVLATPNHITHIVIDKVQKNLRLLDVVHSLIETTNKTYILTGSSARKIKHDGANLLAGRTLVFDLSSFSFLELGNLFSLKDALEFGTLPRVIFFSSRLTKRRFLQSYAFTYLEEEIQAEQVVRQLDPFRRFLEVSAQCSGSELPVCQFSSALFLE